jgi:hypothetical protein
VTRRLLALPLLAAAAIALSGCGSDGSDSAEEVLAETAGSLGEIVSGDLGFRVAATSGENEVGFELDGLFDLGDKGALPVAEIEYTQIAGAEQATATFISTGEEAFVRIDDQTYRLPEDQVDEFGGGSAGGVGLGELRIDGWLENPELSDGGEVGGAETDKIVADLDPVATANDLLALVGALQGDEPVSLEGRSAEQLKNAVESSHIEVFTGKDDRILRRLVIEADFAAKLPEELRDLTLPNAHFELVLELARPNEDVEVDAPQDAQPFPG